MNAIDMRRGYLAVIFMDLYDKRDPQYSNFWPAIGISVVWNDNHPNMSQADVPDNASLIISSYHLHVEIYSLLSETNSHTPAKYIYYKVIQTVLKRVSYGRV
jgi:hypothetical protein